MAYGLKYTVDFDLYQLRVSEKNYSGVVTPLIAGVPACLHKWEEDQPTAPIKGSSLTANIIGVPLLSFYAPNDDEYKGELYHGSDLLFSGFLVQDDCSEPVDDLTHAVTLSFTDNLGLLKNVPFGNGYNTDVGLITNGAIDQPVTTSEVVYISSNNFSIYINGITLAVGDTFQIVFGGSNYGTYTIATVVSANNYTTAEHLPAITDFATIAFSKVLTESKIPLFAVVQACLRATGVEIPFEVFTTLHEQSQILGGTFLELTLIAKDTFMSSETEYTNCYDVLEKVMTAFNATLVQANGQWNMVRWLEVPTTSYKYDSTFAKAGPGTYSNFKVSGFNQATYPEYGYQKKIIRPYNIEKKTFNYTQTPRLVNNADLKKLGAFIKTTTIGNLRLDDYALTGFTNIGGNNAFIRVETDILHDLEIQRYIFQPYYLAGGAAGNVPFSSNDIEVHAGDRIDMSVTFRAVNDTNDSSLYKFAVYLRTGAGIYWNLLYLANSLSWHYNTTFASVAYASLTAADDLTQWRTLSLSSLDAKGVPPLPADGLLYFRFFSENSQSPRQDSYSKEFSFTYTPYISESLRIIGQKHTQTQAINTKNIDQNDITIDDSPRNNINGTLFKNSVTNLLQDRTELWIKKTDSPKRLGEIVTSEIKQLRSRPRTILEGNLHGDVLVSPMTTFTNPAFPNLNFVAGTMEIDYAAKICTGTLNEIYAIGEAAATSVYNFQYILKTD